MKKRSLTIGELSRRTGVPVKTLRFWSDEGLLPPATRTSSGYRLYAEDATVRLDLVRTLRDAGLGLEAIKKVLRKDLSLADALRLQLAAVEAHASSLQRVAAALRAALRAGDPNESDVRRLYAVTQLSNEERKKVIERYHARIVEGIPPGNPWREKLAEAKKPQLPENPTPEQLDAWLELSELLADESFVQRQRESTREAAAANLDMDKLRRANFEAARARLLELGYDERFQRLWRLYLSFCEAGFTERRIGNVQIVLAKPRWRGQLATAEATVRPAAVSGVSG